MAKVKPDSDSQRTPATHVELYCGSFVDIDKFILILLNADSSGPEALQKKIVFDDLAFVCYCLLLLQGSYVASGLICILQSPENQDVLACLCSLHPLWYIGCSENNFPQPHPKRWL